MAHARLLHDRPPLLGGVVTGVGAVAKDVSAHVVFGLATSLAYRALAGSSD